MGRTCSAYGRIQKCIQSLVGIPEGKKSLWWLQRKWEDNIKMDLKEEGCDAKNWMDQWRAYVRAVFKIPGSLKASQSVSQSVSWLDLTGNRNGPPRRVGSQELYRSRHGGELL